MLAMPDKTTRRKRSETNFTMESRRAMTKWLWVSTGIVLFAMGSVSCSKISTGDSQRAVSPVPLPQPVTTARNSAAGDFAPLLNRIWRRSDSSYGPAAGSIYIFLQNGTLLETSCVETYRIAVWSVDPAKPDTLRVVEDQRQVFTATFGEASGKTLHLHQALLHAPQPLDVTLTAVEGEFVCPDLPKGTR
jgi:hypothetical protein